MNDVEQAFISMRDYHIEQGYESKSGPGSAIICTRVVDETIAALLVKYQITSILDAGCGDCHWISRIPLIHEAFKRTEHPEGVPIKYSGIDIVPDQILENSGRYRNANAKFYCGDLIDTPLPTVDLIICRDVLVHLNVEQVRSVLDNFTVSCSRYLLTTTFPEHGNKKVINRVGGFNPLNLEMGPYGMGPPVELFNEGAQRTKDAKYSDKSLGLWHLFYKDPLGVSYETA